MLIGIPIIEHSLIIANKQDKPGILKLNYNEHLTINHNSPLYQYIYISMIIPHVRWIRLQYPVDK